MRLTRSLIQRPLNSSGPQFHSIHSEDFRRNIPNNYRLADFVIVHPREEDTGGLAVFDLNIYSTKLLDLPAGGVGLAFGAQFQDETFSQDVGKELGDW